MQVVLVAALAAAITGCATATTSTLRTVAEDLDSPVLVSLAGDYRLDAPEQSPAALLVAQATAPSGSAAADGIDEEYDPWESFNEKMFEFNRRLDRYVLKPVATGYNYVVPDRVQGMGAKV